MTFRANSILLIYRESNIQTLKSFTWSQQSPNIFCRLDFWLISNNLYDLVSNTEIIPAIKTDHSAIYLEFENINKNVKGPGFWKLNCSVLNDDDYVED